MASIKEFVEISLDDLDIDTGQVRTSNVAKDLDELVESIRKVGMLEPIVVCPADESSRFSIITGQRRFLAHRELQIPTIWAAVLDERLSEIDAKVLSVTENLVRTDLNSKDLIDVCTYLYKHYGTIKSVSEQTGLKYEKVRQYVKYDRLIEPLKNLVDQEKIDIRTAMRVQDAADAGDQITDDEVVMLAREMASMSGAQQQKIVNERKVDPTRSVDEVVEDAKAGGRITQVIVTLSSEVHAALRRYAKDEGTNQDDAALKLIQDGLYVNDYLKNLG